MKFQRSLLPCVLTALALLLQTAIAEDAGSAGLDSRAATVAGGSAAGAAEGGATDRVLRAMAEASPVESVGVQGGAKITFEERVCDLGEVSPGTRHTGRFTFTNTGDAPLKITEVKKCCGVVAELDRQELAPGERGVLTVVYTAGSLAGSVIRQIHVISNDPANPDVLLTIKAKIVLKVVCEPQRLSLLLKGENAGCPEITLASIDNKPFSIKSFTSTDNCLTVDVDTSVQATRFVLRPTANLEKLQGHSSGAIRIAVAHPECDRVDVPFSVLPRFGFNPSTLLVTQVKPQTPIVRDLSVQSHYGEVFEVEAVSSEHGSVKVLDQVKAGNGFRFKVEITPPQRAEDKQGTAFRDVLYVNTKGGDKLAINVYVWRGTDGNRLAEPITRR